MVKKKMSMLLAAVLVASGVATATSAQAADTKATISYVVPATTMVEEDNKMEFVLQSNIKEAVEYRVWAQNLETKEWVELTDGYQKSEVGKHPFQPATVKDLPKGSYVASVWVRKAGSEAKYESFAVRPFKVQKDGYFAKRANLDELGLKDSYKVGEKVTVKGDDQYKLHIYDPSVEVRAEGWIMDETYEGAAETTYEFKKPGTYLVDVWGKTADSANRFDGWVLKVVTVTEDEVEKTPALEVVSADTEKLPFQTLVQIKLDTDKPEDWKVSVAGKELELKENSKGEKVFIGVLDGTFKADEIKEKAKVEAVVKVEVPAFEVVGADTEKLPFQTLVQIKLETEKPELFTVKVGETVLELKENSKGEKVFIGVVDGTLKAEAVKEKVQVAVK